MDMAGLQRVTATPEPATFARATEQAKRADQTPSEARDKVQISPKAEQVAAMARLFEETEAEAKAREEKVTRIRENIQQGAYKLQEAVLQVAARVSRYLRTSPRSESV